jgi:hypothetical protein
MEEEQCSLIDSMKKINIKDMLYWIADSWNVRVHVPKILGKNYYRS